MSLKQEIETWVTALERYDNNEFDEALKSFDAIADTSKILFNCGVIHATLGEHERAVEYYQKAVKLDQYLAVAYFQQGVSNFLMGDFEEALANFNDTLLYLRGNNNIDYEQLGLKFKLYSCEVLFNRGLCYIYLQQKDAGMQDLSFAVKEKVVPDHDVIDEAIREQAEGYTVFSIPVGIVYRPNEAKVKNLKTKDYLGKARLIAASDRGNAFTGFAGSEMKKMQEATSSAKDDRPDEKISYAATNLVKPGLTSRARQQSEPPINRNMFPPTPPPESENRPGSKSSGEPPMSRAQSVRGGGPRPPALELGRAAFEQPVPERPRQGTQRSASERPRARKEYSSSRTRETRDDNSSSSGRSRSSREKESRNRVLSDDSSGMDQYQDEVYDMYGSKSPDARSKYGRSRSKPQRPMYIEEEEEDFDGSDADEIDDGEFEMISRSKTKRVLSGGKPPLSGRSNGSQQSSSMRSGSSAQKSVSIRKIRVKVHSEDTRYVMIGPAIEFRDFVGSVREKFGLKRNFKIMMRDEGDMITMSDQDDLDMAIGVAKQAARRERAEMGKMEVWVQEV